MKSQISQTPQGPLEYTLIGKGPVVLVLHGTSSDCFTAIEPDFLLEAGFSVLTPSRPGYGKTPLATGRTADAAAEAVACLLDNLHVETCAVVAISGGGPTGIAFTANHPQRVPSFALIAAISDTANRTSEPGYQSQLAFYGPMHNLNWTMLRIFSSLVPRQMARQTLAIFSTHDPEDALRRLSAEDIRTLCHFYQRSSSRAGAINDIAHQVSQDQLRSIRQPTLVIHSREDGAVPFSHAECSLRNIPGAVLYEAGFTGHFFWVGPDYAGIQQRLVDHLRQTCGKLGG